MKAVGIIIGMFLVAGPACQAADTSCAKVKSAGSQYVVCQFDPADVNIGLSLKNSKDEVYGDFSRLAADRPDMVFAMNGGMYHRDRAPVGLYIEEGVERQPISTKPGPGNFHMLPNGVFWMERHGETEETSGITFTPRVGSTERYLTDAENMTFATQSGPMLVIDGELHPRFMKDSESLKIRNGVGITEDGYVAFVLSDTPVSFHAFASLFRDVLGADNALYLDGTISRIYAKDINRNDSGLPMGPIITVSSRAEAIR